MILIILFLVTFVATAYGAPGEYDLCFNALRVCNPDPCVNFECPEGQTCRTCSCHPACYNLNVG